MKFFLGGKQKKKKKLSDVYQDSVNKIGSEQFKELLKKGLQVPIALL